MTQANRATAQLATPDSVDIVAAIATAIETDILLGRLKPRERLIEDALARRFAVNRAVVRRALGELERLGLVEHEAFRGAKVRDYTLSEIEEICEMRQVLLARAIDRIAMPVAPDALEAIERERAGHARAVEARDLLAIYRHNASFHALIHALSGNRRMAAELDRLAWLLTIVRAYRFVDPATMSRAVSQHAAIMAALAASDRGALASRALDHMAKPADIFRNLQDWAAQPSPAGS